MSNFITKLLKRTDAAMPALVDWNDLDLDETDLVIDQPKLAIETTLDTVALRLRALSANKAHLQSEIARMTEELRQTNVAIDAMTAAAKILTPSTTPEAPALSVVG